MSQFKPASGGMRSATDIDRHHTPALSWRATPGRLLSLPLHQLSQPSLQLELAIALAQDKQVWKAEQILNQLLLNHPAATPVLFERARLLRATARPTLALADLEAAYAVDPNPNILAQQVRVLAYLGQAQLAEQRWRDRPQGRVDPKLARAIEGDLRLLRLGKAGLREQALVRQQAILLGTLQDDGQDIHEYCFYSADYIDVAETLGRFLSFWSVFQWPVTIICSLEPDALPLARVLGEAMNLPIVSPQAITEDDFALMVAVRTRPVPIPSGLCLHFALCSESASQPEIQASDDLPDLCGVLCPLSVPWSMELEWYDGLSVEKGRRLVQRKAHPPDAVEAATAALRSCLAKVHPPLKAMADCLGQSLRPQLRPQAGAESRLAQQWPQPEQLLADILEGQTEAAELALSLGYVDSKLEDCCLKAWHEFPQSREGWAQILARCQHSQAHLKKLWPGAEVVDKIHLYHAYGYRAEELACQDPATELQMAIRDHLFYDPPVEELEQALTAPDLAVLSSLLRVGSLAQAPRIRAWLFHPDVEVVKAVLKCLAAWKDPEPCPLQFLDHPDPGLRRVAAQLLACQGRGEALLSRLLKEQEVRVQEALIEGLAEAGLSQAVPVVRELAWDAIQQDRSRLLQACIDFAFRFGASEEDAPWLYSALVFSELRGMAALTLWRMGHAQFRQSLFDLLPHDRGLDRQILASQQAEGDLLLLRYWAQYPHRMHRCLSLNLESFTRLARLHMDLSTPVSKWLLQALAEGDLDDQERQAAQKLVAELLTPQP